MILILFLPIVVLLFVAGLASVIWGMETLRKRFHVRSAYRSDIGSVEDGLVELNGKAKTYRDTVPAPFSGEECLFFGFTVEEYHRTGDDPGWEQVESGYYGVPFLLADEKDEILVDPEGARLEVEHQNSYELPRGRIPPEEIQETGKRLLEYFEEEEEPFDMNQFQYDYGRDRLYTEYLLMPGDEIYVVGEVMSGKEGRTAQYDVDQVLFRDADTPGFFVSDRAERKEIDDEHSVMPSLVGGTVLVILGGMGTWGILSYFL